METIKASLDNWLLNILDISDNMSMSIVRHEYIGTDGAELEILGTRPREISFRAYFFGFSVFSLGLEETPENTPGAVPEWVVPSSYYNHYSFVKYLNDSQLQEHVLNHPKYGIILGFVESFQVYHDDTQDFVAIDIRFIEKDIQNRKLLAPDFALNVDQQFVDQLNKGIAAASRSMQSSGFGSLLGKVIDPAVSIAQQFRETSQDIRKFINECDKNIQAFDNFLYNVTAPLNAIDAAVMYIGDVPSLLIGSINGACNRIIASFAGISNLPLQFVNNFLLQSQLLYDTITVGDNKEFFQTHVKSVTAGAILRQSGAFLNTEKKNTSRQTAPGDTFDANGNRVRQAIVAPIMTTQDLDYMIAQIRTNVQSAVVLDRNNTSLRTLSATIIDQYNTLRKNLRTTKVMQVNNMPLMALLLQLGQPYYMADLYLSMNPQIRNPNFVSGNITVYG